jgi:hypothetical protein
MATENNNSDEYDKFFEVFLANAGKGKDGKVFNRYLSLLVTDDNKEPPAADNKTLEKEQMEEREEWNAALQNVIEPHYRKLPLEKYPVINSIQDVLKIRLVPPLLTSTSDDWATPSKKTATRERQYPPEFYPWQNLKDDVANYPQKIITISQQFLTLRCLRENSSITNALMLLLRQHAEARRKSNRSFFVSYGVLCRKQD